MTQNNLQISCLLSNTSLFLFLLLLPAHNNHSPDDGIDVDRGHRPHRGPHPVDEDVVEVGVAAAAELEAGSLHRVVVAAGVVKG